MANAAHDHDLTFLASRLGGKHSILQTFEASSSGNEKTFRNTLGISRPHLESPALYHPRPDWQGVHQNFLGASDVEVTTLGSITQTRDSLHRFGFYRSLIFYQGGIWIL